MTTRTDLNVLIDKGMMLFPVAGVKDGKCGCGDAACGSPGKHPLVKNWQELATNDVEKLRAWAKQFRGCNWGIACGQSDIFVIDMDPRHGGDESLAALEKEHGPLPPSWIFLTGGGGVHFVFRDPGVDLDLRNSASKLGPGLDTRGHGGFIVAPVSRHISGRVYSISVDAHPDDIALASLPAWLLHLLTAPNGVNGHKMPVPAEEWRALVEGDIGEGRRNDALTRLAGYLLRHWIDGHVALRILQAINTTNCVPPLPPDEVEGIFLSIAKAEVNRRAKVQQP